MASERKMELCLTTGGVTVGGICWECRQAGWLWVCFTESIPSPAALISEVNEFKAWLDTLPPNW